MEIRAKDKIFLALFIPAALVSAYLFFWRIDASNELERLERRCAALVATEDFPLAEKRLELRVKEAEERLDSLRNEPVPEPLVLANPAESAAGREIAVMRVFRESGLVVTRSEAVDLPGASRSRAKEALEASGALASPVRRRYGLDGSYPSVKRALDAFCRERLAVVPDGIQMRSAQAGRWTLDLWL